MAVSSINIQLSHKNSFQHNDRSMEKIPEYIFDGRTEFNEFNRDAKRAEKYAKFLEEKAIKNYTKRTKQRIQTAREKFYWSAVINLNKKHTLIDVENLADALEKKYGWQPIQIAIHNDEGHIDDNGKFQPNKHAHIEFLMLDENGIYRFKKRDFRKKDMSELQSFVADFLEMDRGKNYQQERKEAIKMGLQPSPKPIRKNAHQYREAEKRKQKQRREKELQRELEKKLKDENKRIRDELKEAKAKRQDYAIWEAEKKELENEIKQKNIKLQELENKIKEQDERIQELEKNKNKIETFEKNLNYFFDFFDIKTTYEKWDKNSEKIELWGFNPTLKNLDTIKEQVIGYEFFLKTFKYIDKIQQNFLNCVANIDFLTTTKEWNIDLGDKNQITTYTDDDDPFKDQILMEFQQIPIKQWISPIIKQIQPIFMEQEQKIKNLKEKNKNQYSHNPTSNYSGFKP